ncbi:MAG: UDP-N-acetyl glucosamine 2-epimerase [Myxococcales bacterium]
MPGPYLLVVGARPNFMKIAPLHAELGRLGLPQRLVHTGQHYDDRMSRVFFEDLGMPAPDVYLGVGSGSHAEQTARVMIGFEQVCAAESPSGVVVVGDVNSTIACALVAAKLWIPVAHVEAGLRSNDRRMPEEVNRLLTDQIADLLFTPSEDGDANLLREGVSPQKIHRVGNIMIDSLLSHLGKARSLGVLPSLGLEPGRYGVLTLHRPSNVDDAAPFGRIVDALAAIGPSLPIVFPVHPRTRKQLEAFGLWERLSGIPGMRLVEPMGYLEFLALTSDARLVLTDSGGLQEETTALRVPCITLRDSTERPVTVDVGSNVIVGSDTDAIIAAAREALDGPARRGAVPPLWDGRTAERIAAVLASAWPTA